MYDTGGGGYHPDRQIDRGAEKVDFWKKNLLGTIFRGIGLQRKREGTNCGERGNGSLN